MKRLRLFPILPVVFALFTGCSSEKVAQTPPPISIAPPPGMQVVEGKLRNQISLLEKSMPRADSQGFVVPTGEEKNIFFNIIADLRTGELGDALTAATTNGYVLIWYMDQNDDNSVSYILREAKPSQKGWGLFVLRVATNSNVIVEAPHPLFDEGTPDVALDVYRALDARALLVAGAHRDANRDGSADASSNAQTIFQAVHESELQQSIDSTGSVIVLQIHGFSANKHPAYPRVVISYEHGNNMNPVDMVKGQQLASRIVNALKDKGVKTGLCGTGEWRDLCGATNIQAMLMTRGIFIHIELDESIRTNDKRFIEALVGAISR